MSVASVLQHEPLNRFWEIRPSLIPDLLVYPSYKPPVVHVVLPRQSEFLNLTASVFSRPSIGLDKHVEGWRSSIRREEDLDWSWSSDKASLSFRTTIKGLLPGVL